MLKEKLESIYAKTKFEIQSLINFHKDFMIHLNSENKFIDVDIVSFLDLNRKKSSDKKLNKKEEDKLQNILNNFLEKKLFNKQPDILGRMTLIYAISICDAFIADTIKEILITNDIGIEILKTEHKNSQIPYCRIFQDRDKFIEEETNQLVNKLDKGPFDDKYKFIHDKLNITINNKDKLNEVYQTRHIIVHNKSLVDEDYINKVADTKFKIGEKRPVDLEYLYESILNMINFIDNLQNYYCDLYC